MRACAAVGCVVLLSLVASVQAQQATAQSQPGATQTQPTLSQTQPGGQQPSATADLRQRLAGTRWQWCWQGYDGREAIVFGADGYVQNDNWDRWGLVTRWEAIDGRTVLLTIEKGRYNDLYAVLTFAPDLSSYEGRDFHSGRIRTSRQVSDDQPSTQPSTTSAVDNQPTVLDGSGPADAASAIARAGASPVHAVPTASQAPTIDGSLDDAAWVGVSEWGPLVLTDGPWPDGRTSRAQIVRHGDYLYLGMRCDCPKATGSKWYQAMLKGGYQRDQVPRSDEIVVWQLGADWTKPGNVLVIFSPNGAFTDSRDGRAGWNGDIQAATTVDDSGWQLEARIRIADVSGCDAAQTFALGANVFRRTKSKEGSWARGVSATGTGLLTMGTGDITVEGLSYLFAAPVVGDQYAGMEMALRNQASADRHCRLELSAVDAAGKVVGTQASDLTLPAGQRLATAASTPATGATTVRVRLTEQAGKSVLFQADLPMCASRLGDAASRSDGTLAAALRPASNVLMLGQPATVNLMACNLGDQPIRRQGTLVLRSLATRDVLWQRPVSLDLPARSRDARAIEVDLTGCKPGRCALAWEVQGLDAPAVPVLLSYMDRQRAMSLSDMPVLARPFCFAGPELPPLNFESPDAVQSMLGGTYSVSTRYYDAQYNEVTSADKPGRYGAIMEATTHDGRTLRRFRTLYCQGRKMEWFGNLDNQQDTAILLAGLNTPGAEGGPVTLAVNPWPAAKPWLADHQWWVTLKRKLYGTDKTFAKPFVCPRPLEGPPAPVVREGTLAEAGMSAEGVSAIDKLCSEWAADSDEAFAVCVVRHGVIVLHKAYGQRDGKAMTVDTPSWMASLIKLICGTALLTVVDQGVVGVDDTLERYLPVFAGAEAGRAMTVHHLYTHTSGLQGHWGDELADLEEIIAEQYPYLAVGQVYEYNGTGLNLGCKIMEAVSGEAMESFYRNHLLDPLGCSDRTSVRDGGGGAASVPLDMARIGQLLLNRGSYGDKLFFGPQTLEQLLPKPLACVMDVDPSIDQITGLGCVWLDDGGILPQDSFGHGAASSATLRVVPSKDLVISMTRNNAGRNFSVYHPRFIRSVVEAIADEDGAQPK